MHCVGASTSSIPLRAYRQFNRKKRSAMVAAGVVVSPFMAERDYVLGTHDEEIERLGLQHLVWRPRMMAAWGRAGVTRGSRVLDVGAGPGFATADLAEVVGETG